MLILDSLLDLKITVKALTRNSTDIFINHNVPISNAHDAIEIISHLVVNYNAKHFTIHWFYSYSDLPRTRHIEVVTQKRIILRKLPCRVPSHIPFYDGAQSGSHYPGPLAGPTLLSRLLRSKF